MDNILIKSLLTIFAIIGTIWGFHMYMNHQIEKKINDPEYMSKVSKILRPFLVFNEKGITIYDHGAKKYIIDNGIEVGIDKIVINTKVYLQHPPLIMFIGAKQYSYEPTRLDDKKWSYDLQSIGTLIDTGGKEPNKSYMLEILL